MNLGAQLCTDRFMRSATDDLEHPRHLPLHVTEFRQLTSLLHIANLAQRHEGRYRASLSPCKLWVKLQNCSHFDDATTELGSKDRGGGKRRDRVCIWEDVEMNICSF